MSKIYLENVTLCLTIGKRPNELRESLGSLLSKLDFKKIIAINDFGDDETNQVFKELCPTGELISLGYNLGHHKAIDLMYSKIQTPYIFHSEDDWLFDALPNFNQLIELLESHQKIVSVCFRKISDFSFSDDELNKIEYINLNGIDIADLTPLHDQWYGYSFNPHLIKKSVYDELAPFDNYKKERHLSRIFRGQGRYVVFFKQGYCHHIGFESIANPPKITLWQKIRGKLLNY